jgi:hypothetical protein
MIIENVKLLSHNLLERRAHLNNLAEYIVSS